MKIIIAGNGPAGYYAAKKIKELESSYEVSIFDPSPCGLFTKVRLPDYVAGKITSDKLILASAEKYAASGIEAHLGENLVSLDTKSKTVTSSTGKVYAYDKLLIASGASASKPDIEGACSRHVYTLRTMKDADEIIARSASAKTATVIGGGLLGLEIAYALMQRNLSVSVLEFFPYLLPRQLNQKEGLVLQKKLEAMGFKFYLDRKTEKILCSGDSLETYTNRNDIINSDMIVFSAGIKPEISLAVSGGLETGRGIKVGTGLKTSANDVYAAGDCAEINGNCCGLWIAAKDQGEAVAAIITGRKDSFDMPPYEPILKVSGVQLKEVKAEAAAQ